MSAPELPRTAHGILRSVVSGGQSGVDRAALDAALFAGIPCGGWCPNGRHAEDGPIPDIYPLEETPSRDYAERTRWNVRDSDGTLILLHGEPTGGTEFTIACAEQLRKPLLLIDPALEPNTVRTIAWLVSERIQTLNVAGPRESTIPGIHAEARAFLDKLFGSAPA